MTLARHLPLRRRMPAWPMFLVAIAALAPGVAPAAEPAGFPSKPVRLIVGFGPGTAMDTVARLLGDRLAGSWGQPVVIENRGGASGNIANETVARSAPDGYTIAIAGITSTILPAMPGRPAVHPLRDLAPVIKLTTSTIVITTHAATPYRTLGDLIAAARKAPGTINYATSGIGTPPHLAAVMLSTRAGIDMVHIPYGQGSAAAQQDTAAGRLSVAFALWSSADAMLRSGQLRPLAVTSAGRFPAAPDVPTVAEQGYPGFEVSTWYGIFAAAGTARETISRLNAEFARVLARPDVRERLQQLGWQIVGNTPEEFGADVRADLERWPPILRGLKFE